MWNVITSNRLLEVRMRRESYRKHQKALKGAKAQVDVSEPARYGHLSQNLKAKQLAHDEEREIEIENRNLLRKMIEQRSKLRPNSAAYFPKDSLNETHTRRVSDRINSQNKKLLLRLSDTTPSINFHRMERQHMVTERIKTNISRSRPKSGHSTNRTNFMRPMSAR